MPIKTRTVPTPSPPKTRIELCIQELCWDAPFIHCCTLCYNKYSYASASVSRSLHICTFAELTNHHIFYRNPSHRLLGRNLLLRLHTGSTLLSRIRPYISTLRLAAPQAPPAAQSVLIPHLARILLNGASRLRPQPPLSPCLPPPVPMLSNTAIVMHNIDQHGYLRTSQPAPAVRICADLYKLRRSTYTIPPLPLATSSMFRFCLSYQLHGVERADLLSAELIALVAAARKPTTTIKHTGYFTKWIQFASQRGRPPLPILPVEFAEFLIQSSRADRTASPTLNRCSAATFYCNLAAVPNPMEHPFCKLVKDALHRRLGIRGQKKLPLLRSQLNQIIMYQMQHNPSLHTLSVCFTIMLMYEGCLRWSDFHQLRFGDIVIAQSYFRLFIESAKTDQYRRGQWVTITISEEPYSAFSLLLRLIEALATLWISATPSSRLRITSSLPRSTFANPFPLNSRFPPFFTLAMQHTLPLCSLPLSFQINSETQLPSFARPMTYPVFLSILKRWASLVDISPDDIGTHSLRRGLSSDWALLGIPDRLRRAHGRWRSAQIADGYIDESIDLQLRIAALSPTRPLQNQSTPRLLLPTTTNHIIASPAPQVPIPPDETPESESKRPKRKIRLPPRFRT